MTDPDRRRPQWRGERKAVLVCLPLEVADRLLEAATNTHRSVSDQAAELITRGLDRQAG